MPLSDRYMKRQQQFLECVNTWCGNSPTFKMDPAYERITLIEAPSGFIRVLIDNGASLFLKSDGLRVEFLSDFE
jgi:hypothetical protein